MGDRAFEAVRTAMEHRRGAAMKLALEDAVDHLEICATWGLWVSPDLDRRLASLHQLRGDASRTEFYLRRILAADPRDREARLRLATTMIAVDRLGEAAVELEAVESDTSDTDLLRRAAAVHARLAEVLDRAGDPAAAVHQQRVEQLRLRLQAR